MIELPIAAWGALGLVGLGLADLVRAKARLAARLHPTGSGSIADAIAVRANMPAAAIPYPPAEPEQLSATARHIIAGKDAEIRELNHRIARSYATSQGQPKAKPLLTAPTVYLVKSGSTPRAIFIDYHEAQRWITGRPGWVIEEFDHGEIVLRD